MDLDDEELKVTRALNGSDKSASAKKIRFNYYMKSVNKLFKEIYKWSDNGRIITEKSEIERLSNKYMAYFNNKEYFDKCFETIQELARKNEDLEEENVALKEENQNLREHIIEILYDEEGDEDV